MASSASSETPTKKPITFMSLPAELRNHIYALAGSLTVWQCKRCFYSCFADVKDPNRPLCVWSELHDPGLHEWVTKAIFWVNRSSRLSSEKYLREPEGDDITKNRNTSVAQPDLAKVNKQIRTDTLSIFYGNQTFVFTVFDEKIDAPMIGRWLKTIGWANATMLRSVKVVYRSKKTKRFITKDLVPEMGRMGVKTDVVETLRFGYPYCYCEKCIMALVKGLKDLGFSQ